MDIKKEIVGQVDGKDVYQFTLTNAGGMSAKVLSYGAIVTHLYAPDRDGKMENVVLGFDDPAQYWTEPYINDAPYFGSVVGRYGNRIAQGKFTLNGKEYLLATNNGPNHLHGGLKGFDKVVWDAEPVMTEEGQGVKLTYNSVDGEEGYPGNLTISITYTLTKDNCLKCDYSGTIDQPCPVNVTHHGYFNLTGGAKTNVLGHEMQIMADRYTVVDETLIPTGELRPVAGTPMDFTEPHTIGERIDQVEGGYDHNYVLSDDVTELRPVATVKEPVSGRSLEVLTTEPGVQFYSGNFLLGNLTGSGGVVYNKHWGFCLETQHYPDSPNQPTFPSTILEPGEKYSHTTVYRFGN
ncbi:MAG: galactose mutarotase [Bacteroidales bacterium]|nr:galactose mutarotase [Bacteroidales bacterium]